MIILLLMLIVILKLRLTVAILECNQLERLEISKASSTDTASAEPDPLIMRGMTCGSSTHLLFESTVCQCDNTFPLGSVSGNCGGSEKSKFIILVPFK